MIITLLMGYVDGFINLFLTLRPSWQPTLPPSVSSLIGFDLAYDNLLPINEMLTCAVAYIGLMLTMVGFKWIIKLIDWVADIIP